MSTNAEKLLEIGMVVLKYLVGYANVCCIVQKGAVVTLIISGVTGLIHVLASSFR